MWLQCAEIDLNDIVVMLLAALVGLEEVQVLSCGCRNVASVCCGEIAAHGVRVWKDAGRRTDLCRHIAYGGHGGCTQCRCSRSKKFEDFAFASRDCKKASEVKDDIWQVKSVSKDTALRQWNEHSPFVLVHPPSCPVSLTPMIFGH